jgi:DNA modification methylase
MPASRLLVEDLPLSSLIPSPTNARTHSKRQISQIAASIRRFGFNNPILADADNTVRAGHGRLEAAKQLGMATVPVIRASHMSPADFRAYALADNRLAEEAGWDEDILAIEFQELRLIAPNLDLTLTGFEVAEIDLIVEQAGPDEDPADEAEDLGQGLPVVCRAGDLWLLGDHRIFCGSALEPAAYRILLEGQPADAVFTDPPYNVKISGHVSGKGAIQHREFAMASGEMTDGEFRGFLRSSASMLAANSKPGSMHFICMDWRHALPLLDMGTEFYELKNICVWVKDNGGMGSLYRSQHELVMVFKRPGGEHQNNVQLGRFGRNRTNVWSYPGVNSFSRSGEEGNLLALHPTVKPVQLVADAVLDCTAPGNIVLDAFLGSGSTLIAAERTHRRCYGIELDPAYVDAAIRRWQRHTGGHAIHATSKARFDDLQPEVQGDV